MKKTLLLLITALLQFSAFCQQTETEKPKVDLTKHKPLEIDFDYSAYMLSDKRTYIETYMLINGESVRYTINDINLESKIDVTMVFKNADDIVEFRHFIVSNPPLPDTTLVFPNFINVQRIFIPQGIYNFEIKIEDLNAAPELKKVITKSEIIAIDIPQKQTAMSNIEFLESFNPTQEQTINQKNGYECIPYCKSQFPCTTEYLRFYTELYNVATELGDLGSCSIYTSIKDIYTQKSIVGHSSTTNVNALNYYRFLKERNMSKLPTGKYFLSVEVCDKHNKPICSGLKYFERTSAFKAQPSLYTANNKVLNSATAYTNSDSLAYIIKCHSFIADSLEKIEINKVITSADIIIMQRFLYNFWMQRNQFDPDNAFTNFAQLVDLTREKKYSKSQTEIIMRYGIPNIVSETIVDGTPIIKWQYTKIGNLSNISFFFSDDETAQLLHSNMPTEKHDSSWSNNL